jgi:hypothetical protein
VLFRSDFHYQGKVKIPEKELGRCDRVDEWTKKIVMVIVTSTESQWDGMRVKQRDT